MGKVRTHLFKLGLYHIETASSIEGVTDFPTKRGDKMYMTILDNNDLKSLHSALHEALHAHGVPDEYIHEKDGSYNTWSIAKFLWRLGYRLKETK